jgi:hypothetical protein
MGLDMFAFAVPQGTGELFELPEDAVREELSYWRKFNALHGWMEDRAREAGFNGTFNCAPFQLSPELIDRLEEDVKNKRLVPRDGFFFGGQTIEQDELDSALEFVESARQAFTESKDVYYDSWW